MSKPPIPIPGMGLPGMPPVMPPHPGPQGGPPFQMGPPGMPPGGNIALSQKEQILAAERERERKAYKGDLRGLISGDQVFLTTDTNHKDFMLELEALMVKYHVDLLDVHWKGPYQDESVREEDAGEEGGP